MSSSPPERVHGLGSWTSLLGPSAIVMAKRVPITVPTESSSSPQQELAPEKESAPALAVARAPVGLISAEIEGESLELLNRMLDSIGLRADAVVRLSVKSSRNREQVVELARTMQVKLWLVLGTEAAALLAGRAVELSSEHGTWGEFEGLPVILSFHPSELLKEAALKKSAWSDLKQVALQLGLVVPSPANARGPKNT